MDKEVWKSIPGFTFEYEASSLGRIRRTGKVYYSTYKGKPVERLMPDKIYTTNKVSKRGYKRINLGNRAWFVHQIIAKTFCPNPENKPQVNHKDGNKLNNRADNLEWCTNTENRGHAESLGLIKRGFDLPQTRLSTQDKLSIVVEYRHKGNCSVLAEQHGISYGYLRKLIERFLPRA